MALQNTREADKWLKESDPASKVSWKQVSKDFRPDDNLEH